MKLDTGTKLEPAQVKAITKAYFEEALKRLEDQMGKAHAQSHVMSRLQKEIEQNIGKREEGLAPEKITERLDYLVPASYSFLKNEAGQRVGSRFSPFFFDGDSDTVFRYVLEENDLELEAGSPSYNALQKGVGRAIAELKHQHRQRMDFEPEAVILDDWFKDAGSYPSGPSSAPAIVHDISKVPLFSKAFDEFMEDHGNEAPTTLNQRKASRSLWIELHGDTLLTDISPDKVREFRKALRQLPKNRAKLKAYRGKTLKELLDMKIPEADKMAPITRSAYIGNMSSFMEWVGNHYTELKLENHFQGKYFKDTQREKDKRSAFTDEKLKILLTTPIYAGCAGTNQIKRYQPGSLIIRDSLCWVPLIALYSGARMGEILRLRPDDLYELEGVWVFDINEEYGKRRKTEKSVRQVPIHPDLIKLGVLEAKKTKKELAFCDTPKSSIGTYSKEFSKKFGRTLRKYGIYDRKTVFHSFRHRFKDQMLKAGISKDLRTALMGHEFEDTHDRVYGSEGVSITMLDEAMKKVQYPLKEISRGNCVSRSVYI